MYFEFATPSNLPQSSQLAPGTVVFLSWLKNQLECIVHKIFCGINMLKKSLTRWMLLCLNTGVEGLPGMASGWRSGIVSRKRRRKRATCWFSACVLNWKKSKESSERSAWRLLCFHTTNMTEEHFLVPCFCSSKRKETNTGSISGLITPGKRFLPCFPFLPVWDVIS